MSGLGNGRLVVGGDGESSFGVAEDSTAWVPRRELAGNTPRGAEHPRDEGIAP